MIQSKNKFLPPLYIRKCKITYLDLFCYSPEGWLLRAATSHLQKALTSHLHATHGCVEYVDEQWMEGWEVNRRSGWSPVRYLEKECRLQEGGHTSCILVSRLARTWRASQPARWAVKPRDVSPVPSARVSVISAEGKRKQKPKPDGKKTVAHSTSCQRKCHSERGFAFHLLVMGWKV